MLFSQRLGLDLRFPQKIVVFHKIYKLRSKCIVFRYRPLLSAGTSLKICLSITANGIRSEEHTSELQSRGHLVCRLLLLKKKNSGEINLNDSTMYNLF